jgi:hypothetical protein
VPHVSCRNRTGAWRMHWTIARVSCIRTHSHWRDNNSTEPQNWSYQFVCIRKEWTSGNDILSLQRGCICHGTQHCSVANNIPQNVWQIMGSIWRFKWRRAKWFWVWVGRRRLNQKTKPRRRCVLLQKRCQTTIMIFSK